MFEHSQEISARETFDSPQSEACALYFALTRMASAAGFWGGGEDPSFGGKLLYAGELNSVGRALVVAGNVAGCATLAATADVAAQKLSVRDGVVDFLVTSLDEALRILKNEIRQRKTVAVCAGVAPEAIEREMVERGVQPDLTFANSPGERRALPIFGDGTRSVQAIEPDRDVAFLTWRVEQAAARWMPRLDAATLGCLAPNSWESRWIGLAPRYLGRSAFAQRVLFCDQNTAKGILRRFADLVREGEIGAEVSVSFASGDESTVLSMKPGVISQKSIQDS